jgi:trk system potassium uptake protein TrkH|nr:TrkH family potassium uptake protein [uncultured Desulfobacter sp.]
MTVRRKLLKLHPAALVLISFLALILIGTLLLCLPVSSKKEPLQIIDALFTSTSAVCVTGLVVVDTGTRFTLLGQVIILLLIQVGGLGVMTLSVLLFRMIGRKTFYHQRMAVQDMFLHTPQDDIFKIVKNIIYMTFCIETAGAVLLAIYWSRTLPIHEAVYTAVFHAISAFCNAGFSLFPDSLSTFGGSYLLNFTVCMLIVTGGIGFSVLYEFKNWIKLRKKKRFRFSVQTKTVLLTTTILIFGGTVWLFVLEIQGSLAGKAQVYQFLVSLFQSITCRTAGFNTIDISALNEATITMMLVLMFFGASPGSCGGGVKTTTLALLTATTITRIKRMRRVNLFKKSIPDETVRRSTTLILVSVGIIGMVLFLILSEGAITGRSLNGEFLPYLFEVISAFGTVGLSLGVTANLSVWGKFWIIITMVIGRVGILTFSYIIIGTNPTNGFERAEENMMIG